MSAYQNNTQMNMPETCPKATAMDGKAWLAANWPVMRVADVNWTMERGEFPSYVKDYICNSGDWIKVNDESGGTYCEKVHFEQSYKKNMIARGWTPPPQTQQLRGFNGHPAMWQSKDKAECCKKLTNEDNAKSENKTTLNVLTTDGPVAAVKHLFANKKQEKDEFNNGMDERNKAALKVLQTEGTDAAVKHMLTDDETGRQLSYSEMRSRYG